MLSGLLRNGMRVFYLAIVVIGLSLAASGYPPPESDVPLTLALGGLLAVIGLAGVVWPEKIRAGDSGPD